MRTLLLGLDRDIAEAIRAEVRSPDNRVKILDSLPDKCFTTEDGVFHYSDGLGYSEADFVVFYSYWPDAYDLRKCLAFSKSTFPCVKNTIVHDDKDLSFLHVYNYMQGQSISNFRCGYVKADSTLDIVDYTRVFKAGNKHCGDGKFLLSGNKQYCPAVSGLIQPFIDGESYRVLLIDNQSWIIKYESKDWRKNVNSKKTILNQEMGESSPIFQMKNLAKKACSNLNLSIAGFDFIVKDNMFYFLEVNCYPEIPEEAKQFFIELAINRIIN